MAMEEPQLKGTVQSRTSKETFRRRLSYYVTGLLIGMLLVAMLLYARWSWQQKQAAERRAAPVEQPAP